MRPSLLEAKPVGSLAPIPDPLARGAVRPGHILFLYTVIFVTVSILGFRLGEHADPAIQYAYRGLLGQVGAALLVIMTLRPAPPAPAPAPAPAPVPAS